MKKRNKSLPKRLLAMSLSLAMCLSMVCTTAFADGANTDPDNAYVYINVEPEKVNQNGADDSDMPSFDRDAAKTETGLTTKESAVEEKTEALEQAGDAPTFDPKGTLAGAVDAAAGEVTEKLEALESADQPTWPDDASQVGDGNNGDNSDDSGSGDDTSDLPVESDTFDVDDVANRVDALNDAIEPTEDKVEAAKIEAEQKLADVNAKKTELETAANNALMALETKRNEADAAVAAAKALTDALPGQQKDLQDELNGKIAELTVPAAPAVEDFETYEAYETYYNETYTKAVEAYNGQVADLKTKYDEELKKLTDSAEGKVTDAQAALDAADAALTTFRGAIAEGNFTQVTADIEGLGEYKDALDAYNQAAAVYEASQVEGENPTLVDGYNKKAEDFNDAAAAYDGAVSNYNSAVDTHNTAAHEYNQTVTEYETAITEYNTAANAYNEKVDTYNSSAATWNSGKTDSDYLVSVLAKVDPETVKVYREVAAQLGSEATPAADGEEAVNPVSTLTKDEVEAYNTVIKAYNDGLKAYNEGLVQSKLEEVDRYFTSQGTHTSLNGSNWYTLGKVSVNGLFTDDLFTRGNKGTFSQKKDENGNYIQPDSAHNTLVTWTKTGVDEKGNPIFTSVDGTKIGDGGAGGKYDVNHYYNTDSVKNTDELEEALKTNGLIAKETKPGEAPNPVESVDKWVLVMARGADDYNVTDNPGDSDVVGKTLCLHINGYLYVQQLGKLAELEVRAETKTPETTTRADENVSKLNWDEENSTQIMLSGESGIAVADTYNTYDNITVPDDVDVPEDERPNWSNSAPSVDVDPLTRPADRTPAEITPPPDTTGGGGGGGGGGTPPVIIEDPDVPLAETPEIEEPVVEIPDEEVPLAETPEEVVIPDEDVPLAEVPKTGDISAMWYTMTMASACGLAALALRRKENA